MNIKQFATATLFALVLLTVASTPLSGQQTSGSYDPWLDYNEDGSIDVDELHSLGEVYGSSGDPTKNVTITGHATKYLRPGGLHFPIPPDTDWLSDMISIDGYAKVTVLILLSAASNCYYEISACDDNGCSWKIEQANVASWVKTYDVMNQRIQILIHNKSSSAITADVGIYLVA